MRFFSGLLFLALVSASLGCDRPADDTPAPQPPYAPLPAAGEPEEEQAVHGDDGPSREDRAVAADRALRQRLLGRVMEVAQEDGLAAAVTVCHEEAIPITESVAGEFHVTMGRVSDRLRNPDNTAPDWAISMIEEARDEAGDGPPTEALVVANDTLRRVSPLHIAAPCLGCHGEKDSLPEEVQSALDRYYPDDQATGYAEGDLRGWVWVEVP